MSETIGDLIDQVYFTRAARLSLEREAASIKKMETELSNTILDKLKELELSAAKGSSATFSYKVTSVPAVKNWEEVYKFIRKEDEFSLLQKKLSDSIWMAHLDDGLLIPGTEVFERTRVSITKSKQGK